MFSFIIQQIILPIIVLIVVGSVLQRKFELEMRTFSKLILYLYVPALTFVNVYEAKADMRLVASVFVFFVMQFIAVALLGNIISRLNKHSRQMKASFSNSIVLSNNGNIGIPLNALAFAQNPLAMSIQMMAVLFEILITFTYGLMNASAASLGLKKALQQFIKMPIFYCFIIGLLLNLCEIKLPGFIEIPMKTVANGMLSIALVSIGAQLAKVKFYANTRAVMVSSLVRLVISPLMAYCIIISLNLHGIVAQALWIASAMPSSRNSAALALEYGNEPEFAAQTVLVSTLLSSVTLTAVIYLAMSLFK